MNLERWDRSGKKYLLKTAEYSILIFDGRPIAAHRFRDNVKLVDPTAQGYDTFVGGSPAIEVTAEYLNRLLDVPRSIWRNALGIDPEEEAKDEAWYRALRGEEEGTGG